jgi:hypothetical protein
MTFHHQTGRMPAVQLAIPGLALGLALVAGARAQDIAELQWRQGTLGALEMALAEPSHHFETHWYPLFPWVASFREEGGTAPLATALAGMQPEFLLPLLWHGPGGAAAIPDATKRLQKLGLGTALVVSGPSKGELIDLLRVAHLSRQPWRIATMTLRRYAEDPLMATSVRDAALGELAARKELLGLPTPPTRLDSRDTTRPVPSIPVGSSWWLALDLARFGPIDPVWQARRGWAVRSAATYLLAMGASTSPATLADMQRWVDGPGQLPVELAQLVGNWRVDRMLLVGYQAPRVGWFLVLDGAFDVPRLRAALLAAGATVERLPEGAVAGAALRLGAWSVTVRSDSLEIATSEIARRERAALDGRFRSLADQGAAFGGWNEQVSLGLGGLEASRGTWSSSGRRLQAHIAVVDPDRAAAQLQAERSLLGHDPDRILDGVLPVRELEAEAPGVRESDRDEEACRRLVSAVQVAVEESALVVTVDLGGWPELELIRLLKRWPRQWLLELRK